MNGKSENVLCVQMFIGMNHICWLRIAWKFADNDFTRVKIWANFCASWRRSKQKYVGLLSRCKHDLKVKCLLKNDSILKIQNYISFQEVLRFCFLSGSKVELTTLRLEIEDAYHMSNPNPSFRLLGWLLPIIIYRIVTLNAIFFNCYLIFIILYHHIHCYAMTPLV